MPAQAATPHTAGKPPPPCLPKHKIYNEIESALMAWFLKQQSKLCI